MNARDVPRRRLLSGMPEAGKGPSYRGCPGIEDEPLRLQPLLAAEPGTSGPPFLTAFPLMNSSTKIPDKANNA